MKHLHALTLAALLLNMSTPQVRALDYYVTSLNDSGNGSLRSAIDNANGDNTDSFIYFSVSGQINLASVLPTISTNMTISGLGQDVTLDGGGTSRIMLINGGYLYADNLTFQNGSNSIGGAMNISSSGTSGATISNSYFYNNTADRGGAIYGRNPFTVADSTFDGNTANQFGGALYMERDDLTVNNSTFTNNTAATSGGAINILGNVSGDSTTIGITGSTFTGNEATGSRGGAIYVQQLADMTVSQTTVDDNTAGGNGGGIFNLQSNVTVEQSTISNNTAGGDGGGIDAISSGASLTVINSTVSGNHADGEGGGIHTSNSGTNTITASTIADNTADDGAGGIAVGNGSLSIGNVIVSDNLMGEEEVNLEGAISSNGYNLIGDDSLTSPTEGDILNGEADLLALADNGGPTFTRLLGDFSQAIDAGDTDLPIDQRGEMRPFNYIPDIGAVELQYVVPEPATGSLLLLSLLGTAALRRRR